MKDESIWNVESLKLLMDERDKRYLVESQGLAKAIELLEKHHLEKEQLKDKAVDIYANNAQRWMESSNEWRQAMGDKDRNFVTKGALWGYFAGILGASIAIAALVASVLIKGH